MGLPMTKSLSIRLGFLVLAALSAAGSIGLAIAANDEEKAGLVQLVHELDALEPVISEAQNKALVDTRIRFNYGWLRSDLNYVKSGIQEYLASPGNEPRKYPPLRGGYRQ